MIELTGITTKEINSFYNSPDVKDRRFYLRAHEDTLKADYVSAIRIDGEVAGIGGLVHSTVPFVYMRISIMKPKYQGQGLAKQLAKNDVKYMREKKKGYILLGLPSIDNAISVKICLKVGYRICGKFDSYYMMICPVRRVRDKCVEVVLRLVCLIYPTPIGLPVRLFAKSKGFYK